LTEVGVDHATGDDVRALVGSEEDLEKWTENEHHEFEVFTKSRTYETRSL
jgi:hypothetical protein